MSFMEIPRDKDKIWMFCVIILYIQSQGKGEEVQMEILDMSNEWICLCIHARRDDFISSTCELNLALLLSIDVAV